MASLQTATSVIEARTPCVILGANTCNSCQSSAQQRTDEERAYQPLAIFKAKYFHQPVGGYEYGRINDTPYRVNTPPFPGEVAISEHQLMRRLKGLKKFVWLEECRCK